MYLADGWQDFEILDAGNGDKLERWGSFVLLRPDPQAVWPMGEHKADAVYYRSQSGGGHGMSQAHHGHVPITPEDPSNRALCRQTCSLLGLFAHIIAYIRPIVNRNFSSNSEFMD